ncbi:MAG TPA: YceI family protein [Polyangiaceae bacterium]|nr:YceI family protein [Polyangiaceae bacterium]
MRLELSPETRVLIDLRATGLLAALGHDPTLSARPARTTPMTIEVADRAAIDVPIDVTFAVAAIDPPAGIKPSDREKIRENMCGRDLLDAARFPTIELHGRYVGSLDGGRLSGELHVRGAPHHISMVVRAGASAGPWSESSKSRQGSPGAPERIDARGDWEGRLTDFGVRPYKALLGALKLEDWIRLRLEGSLTVR